MLLAKTLLLAALVAHDRMAWWEGRWAEDSSWCQSPSGNERPLSLRRGRIQFPASDCVVQSRLERQTYAKLRAVCRSEGERNRVSRRFVLSRTSKGLTLSSSDGGRWRLVPCRSE